MTRHQFIFYLATIFLVGNSVPFAFGTPTAPSANAVPPGTAAPTATTAAAAAKASAASLPKKCLGVVVGAIVGMPVCAVRQPLAEEKYAVASQMNGNNPKPRAKIPVGIFWLPFATAAGLFEAPWLAVGNSVLNYDKPFSKAQFSIVDTPSKATGASSPTNVDAKLERREHEEAR